MNRFALCLALTTTALALAACGSGTGTARYIVDPPSSPQITGDQLGATYEGAWLVFQVLAEQTSAAAVLSFYGDVLAQLPGR